MTTGLAWQAGMISYVDTGGENYAITPISNIIAIYLPSTGTSVKSNLVYPSMEEFNNQTYVGLGASSHGDTQVFTYINHKQFGINYDK